MSHQQTNILSFQINLIKPENRMLLNIDKKTPEEIHEEKERITRYKKI